MLSHHALQQSNKISRIARRKLLSVSIVCFLFMFCEIIGGYLANSLAIMTDAAHMLSDVAGFMISYFAISLG
jgi:zinc transporter 2